MGGREEMGECVSYLSITRTILVDRKVRPGRAPSQRSKVHAAVRPGRRHFHAGWYRLVVVDQDGRRVAWRPLLPTKPSGVLVKVDGDGEHEGGLARIGQLADDSCIADEMGHGREEGRCALPCGVGARRAVEDVRRGVLAARREEIAP